MRLGFRVERFIGADLLQQENIEILAENIQIRENKQTIGELDCLLLKDGKPFHLEIIYKLYLYDQSGNTTEIEHWIGGNRRDSFAKKLSKLKEKQLPLLFNPNTKPLLDSLNLKAEEIEQRVHFRAQLFVPFRKKVQFNLLNEACLKGFFIRPNELRRFTNFEFFIPYKRDWLIEPQEDVDWINYQTFKAKIDSLVIYKSYPLCWIRFPDGRMTKFFVVWWD